MAGEEEGGILYTLETAEGTYNSSKKPGGSYGPYTGFGKATYTNEDRDVYEGEFVEGNRCGWGTYIFKKNGDVYSGQYEENCKHGLGRINYSSTFGGAEDEGAEEGGDTKPRGGFYHGYFTKGLRGCPDFVTAIDPDLKARLEEGGYLSKGKLVKMHDTKTVEVEFPNTVKKERGGKPLREKVEVAMVSIEKKEEVGGETMKSEGTFTYCNGDVYVGQWKDGKKHGNGTYACAADGSKLKGEWAEGKITTGQWIFPNGAFFSGRFRYNKPFGKGVWVFPNGNQLTGEYEQKELVGEEGEGGGAAEEGEDAPKKDPQVECTFKYGNFAKVKGDALRRQKYPAPKEEVGPEALPA